MTSELRRDVLRIPGAADPAAGRLPILHGIARPGFDSAVAPYPDMARNLEYGRPATLLPYTTQDSYTRERTDRELPTLVLENEVLTATFLPDYGGRLWSLVHRPTGRELLHRNPILQPANLALRDAWLAGGVEWNIGGTGHWPLTCEPLHAVRLSTPDGTPVLRMYEFERMRRVVMTVDAWLPAGSPTLLVHVALHNPAETPTPVYWWSNIAVPQSADVRVVAPAERAFHFDYTAQLKLIGFPESVAGDQSYPARFPAAADFFMDIPAGERRWIAALDGNGAGLVQTSTDRLLGRKLFQWGTGAGGQHWQEWLSGPDAEYIEIQAGLARTQLEHLELPGGATWEWVEAYGLLEADPAAVHGTWDESRSAVARALERLVPRGSLDAALAEARRFGGAAADASTPGEGTGVVGEPGARARVGGAAADASTPGEGAGVVGEPGASARVGAGTPVEGEHVVGEHVVGEHVVGEHVVGEHVVGAHAVGEPGASARIGAGAGVQAGAGATAWPEVLHRGSGWGALEVAAEAMPADALRPFGSCDAEQQPWLDLLRTKRLPSSEPPASPVTGPIWRSLLEASADDWHALYHLGLLRLADGDRDGAREAWMRSLADRRNAWAQRALAHLAVSPDERADLAVAAHRLQPELRELTVETLQALLAADRAAEALDLIAALSNADRDHGRIRLYNAQAALTTGDLDEVRRLLDEGITVDNLQEGEASLDLLWLAAHPDLPVPPEYDFRMSGS
ncbi:hypothetical protein ABH935_000851 [Catenulispora sp. GAS73]|uniref:DUF5107 domain-containing protein n=1 Tax=Catenulispora sp. GAS73 TaxID=3156269 RepID=UPI003514B43E